MTDTLPSRSYIPSLIPPGVDPSIVDSTMFQNYIPGAVKTRKRTSPSQLRVLEDIFTRDKKPASSLRQELATQLDMTQREVQVWFQNRRAKEKKIREKSNKERAKPSASPFKEEDDDSDAELKSSSPRRPPPSSPLAVPLSPNETFNSLPAPRASLPHPNMNPSLNVDTESAYPAPPHPPPSHPAFARTSFSVSPSAHPTFPMPTHLLSLRRASLPPYATTYPPDATTNHLFPGPPPSQDYHRHSVGELGRHPCAGLVTDPAAHRPRFGHRASVPALFPHTPYPHPPPPAREPLFEDADVREQFTNSFQRGVHEAFTNPFQAPAAGVPDAGYAFGSAPAPDAGYTFPPRKAEVDPKERAAPYPPPQEQFAQDGGAEDAPVFGRQGSLQWSESSASTGTSASASGYFPEAEYALDERRGSCVSTSEMFSNLHVVDPGRAAQAQQQQEYAHAHPYTRHASFSASSSSLAVPYAGSRRGSEQLSRRGSGDSYAHAQGPAPATYADAQGPSPVAYADARSPATYADARSPAAYGEAATAYPSPEEQQQQQQHAGKEYRVRVGGGVEASELAMALHGHEQQQPQTYEELEYPADYPAQPAYGAGEGMYGHAHYPAQQQQYTYGHTNDVPPDAHAHMGYSAT